MRATVETTIEELAHELETAQEKVADGVIDELHRRGLLGLVQRRLFGKPEGDAAGAAPPPKTVARKQSGTKPKAKSENSRTVDSPGPRCTVKDCDGRRVAKGLCKAHWERQHNGKPLGGPINRRGKAKGKSPAKASAQEDDPAPASAVEEKTTDKPIEMRALKAGEDVMYQNKTCRRHTRCSLVAKRRGWAGWSCSACSGPGTPGVGGVR